MVTLAKRPPAVAAFFWRLPKREEASGVLELAKRLVVAVLLPKRLPAGLSVLKILPILEPSSFLILAKRPVPVLVEFPKREEPVLNKELVVDEKSPVVGGRLPNKLDPAGLVSSFLSLLPFKFPKREELYL